MHPYRDDRGGRAEPGRDITVYAEYLQAGGRLLTQFRQVDILWLDFYIPTWLQGMPGKGRKDWESEKLYQLIRKLAPQIILNDRLDYDDFPPDIHTPEQFQPTEWVKVNGKPVVWETCQTFSGSWGYHRDEATWKSPEQLIRMLINTVSCGGNLLMNVGPTARGTFDGRAIQALQVYADWMRLHSRSIYGCTQSDFTPPQMFVTRKMEIAYTHICTPGLSTSCSYRDWRARSNMLSCSTMPARCPS
jgi:alpha-L-fucosidase